jgi:hypothetical protein
VALLLVLVRLLMSLVPVLNQLLTSVLFLLLPTGQQQHKSRNSCQRNHLQPLWPCHPLQSTDVASAGHVPENTKRFVKNIEKLI